jgi:acyl carrier protein
MEIEAKLKQIFSEVFNVPVSMISVNTKQKMLNEWDSLGQLRLIMAIEESFDVSFSIDEIESLINFQVILQNITDKLSAN